MKRITFLIIISILIVGCSKSDDPAPIEDGQPKRLVLNIKEMVTYINQDYDAVREKLKANAMLDKTEMGDRSFTVVLTDGTDIVLGSKIKESNKKVSEINIEYNGVVGGHPVGDPYENELWYYYINKVEGLYGESNSRVYNKTAIKLPSSNTELIEMVKKDGYKDASYYAKWDLESEKELTVFHANTGDFLLQIKSK